MALITCKECGKEISDTAITCPHCGAPTPLFLEKARKEKRKKSCALSISLLLGSMVCILGLILAFMFRNFLKRINPDMNLPIESLGIVLIIIAVAFAIAAAIVFQKGRKP